MALAARACLPSAASGRGKGGSQASSRASVCAKQFPASGSRRVMPPKGNKSQWGKTPWGAAFLQALGDLDNTGRLQRGKTIANTGKVLSFTLQGQQVVARVEGSFNPYYDVQLRFPAFSQAERANVLACINEQPMLLGAILSGALPDELIAALAKRNVHLLPRQWSEIIGGCNCPDNQGMGGGSFASKPAGAPCKHQAAVYFVLSGEFDKDPFSLFNLRGLNLKAADAPSASTAAAAASLPWPLELSVASAAAAAAAAASANSEEESGPLSGPPRIPSLPIGAAFILNILTPNPPFSRTVDYKAALSEFYATLTNAKKLATQLAPLALPEGKDGARLLAAVTQGRLSLELGPDLRGRILVRSDLLLKLGSAPAPAAANAAAAGAAAGASGSGSGAHQSALAAEVFASVPHTPAAGGAGAALELPTALRLLLQLPHPPASSRSYTFFWALARGVRSVLRSGALLPDVLPLAADDSRWRIVWKPLDTAEPVANMLAGIAAAHDAGCVTLRDRQDGSLLKAGAGGAAAAAGAAAGGSGRAAALPLAPASAAAHTFAAMLTAYVLQTQFMHKGAKGTPPKESLAFFKGEVFSVLGASERTVAPSIGRYFGAFELSKLDLALRLQVRQAAAGAAAAAAAAAGAKPAARVYELSLSARQKAQGDDQLVPLRAFVEGGAARRADALKLLSVLSSHLPGASALLTQDSTPLAGQAFEQLVRHSGSALRALGVRTALPPELAKLLRPKLVTVRVSGGGDDESLHAGKGLVSYLGEAALCQFDYRVALGDDLVSVEEFRDLAAGGAAGLLQYKTRFVELDAAQMTAILDAAAKPPRAPTAHELLQAALDAGEGDRDDGDWDGGDDVSIAAAGRVWVPAAARRGVREALRPKDDTPVPASLQAQLRPYQVRGFRWLANLCDIPCGAVLADDMGLGKTCQTLALLLHLRDSGRLGGGAGAGPALVVSPATLISNWASEARRFAPSLRVHVHHGAARGDIAAVAGGRGAAGGAAKKQKTASGAAAASGSSSAPDLILTSYGTLRAEVDSFKKCGFALIAIDEAQVIKNPGAAVTKAVKSVHAPLRIALSGTPVENRLVELWSLMDFAYPGFLGNAKDFTKSFAAPIEKEQNEERLASLRRITAPFVLRRMKTDPAVAADLPAKTVQDVQATLSPPQAALYQQVLSAHESDLEKGRGAVLKLITALKQVCNHPAMYEPDHATDLELSGKCGLLLDLVRSILDAGEKVLVFSQYVSTLNLLEGLLAKHLFVAPAVLTGEMSVQEKDAAVRKFQNNPECSVFLLSLKAGGVGLNLTAASHVIHFDLWWNPQVENQATDRAYRIGQTKRVMVYRLICAGTFEERVNDMMKRKRELIDLTVAAGENWLADLDAAELKELFALRPTGSADGGCSCGLEY